MTVELLPPDAAYVDSEVASGRYPSSSDFIRETIAAYRARREREEMLTRHREAILEALDESERDDLVEETGAQILARLRAGT